MNEIAAHKNELEALLVNLSRHIAVSGANFVALLNAYIARVDDDLISFQRMRRYAVGANKGETITERTLTQNCTLQYARSRTPQRRAALFQNSGAAARTPASPIQRQLTRDQLSRRRPFHWDNGR
jgi:hypothetical protein